MTLQDGGKDHDFIWRIDGTTRTQLVVSAQLSTVKGPQFRRSQADQELTRIHWGLVSPGLRFTFAWNCTT